MKGYDLFSQTASGLTRVPIPPAQDLDLGRRSQPRQALAPSLVLRSSQNMPFAGYEPQDLGPSWWC